MMENNKITTFWEIIQDNQIEIPVIQRDYAQGRRNERVNQIREEFVAALLKPLQVDNTEGLHLDFVYGRILGKDQAKIIARNKIAVENVLNAVKSYASTLSMEIGVEINQINNNTNQLSQTKFIPLDGQQRLTTLFLLHWYLIQRLSLDHKKELLQVLEGFKYKTRKSTFEFCSFLTKMTVNKADLIFSTKTQVSIQIEKSTLFYRIWKHDPSVKGMLVMLDTFHEELKNTEEQQLFQMWENLTVHKKITFDFLDLDELDQTDDLYVKMNARGKQLTDFEHFKAWLQEYIKKKETLNLENKNWEHKIDTIWLDHFWLHKTDRIFHVDDAIYNYVKNVNLFEYIVNNEEDKISKSLIEKIREPNKDKNFIALKSYSDYNFFSSDSLNFLFKSLTTLVNPKLNVLTDSLGLICCKPFLKENTIQEFFLNENQNLSLWDRTYYYAYLLFINAVNNFEDKSIKSQFEAWMRICRNLIYNTYIQNPETFIKAIKSIKTLSAHKFSIEEELRKANFKVSFFESQAKEERRKLNYFKLGEPWKENIISYENENCFFGQINFLFELLGDDYENFTLFKYYGDSFVKYFKEGIEKNNHLFQRSLLSYGNFTISLSGKKRSFCKSETGGLRQLNDNWRKVFNDAKRLNLLKLLLDDQRNLEEIVDSYSEINWRKYIIHYPSVISYCTNRFFDSDHNLDIRLLNSTTYNGKHTDLYLLVLFEELKKNSFRNFKFEHKDVNNYRTLNNFPSIDVLLEGVLIVSLNYAYDLLGEKKGFEVRSENESMKRELITAFEGFQLLANKPLFHVIENLTEMDPVIKQIVSNLLKLESILIE